MPELSAGRDVACGPVCLRDRAVGVRERGSGPTGRSVFVIAGVAPGKTHVEIDTRRGTESFAVFISP